MTRKSFLLAFLFLPIAFVSTISNAATQHNPNDPNLVGYWKLDEVSGTVAVDSSSHGGNDGELWDQAVFSPAGGVFGGAVLFSDANDRVRVPVLDSNNGPTMTTDAATVTLWAKVTDASTDRSWKFLVGLVGPTPQPSDGKLYKLDRTFLYMGKNNTVLCVGIGDQFDLDREITDLSVEQWYHLALTRQADAPGEPNGTYICYVDGIDMPSGVMRYKPDKNPPQIYPPGTYRGLFAMPDIGDLGNAGKDTEESFVGLIDEAGFYNRVLSREEICALAGADPNKAWNPSPDDGYDSSYWYSIVSPTPTLSWSPGVGATSHDVYFGTDAAALSLVSPAQTEPNYTAGNLTVSQTYYWRIDENGASGTTTGDIWSFTTDDGKTVYVGPSNGAPGLNPIEVVLSWTGGDYAVLYDVYLGTDFDDVNDANNLLPVGTSVYKGSQAPDANSYDPCGLGLGTTYYWRIDADNGASGISRGDIWSFSTETGQAKNPNPSTGKVSVSQSPTLIWAAGCFAASHDVYFGADYNDVNDAVRLAGDVDGSGQVDFLDILVVGEQWQQSPPGSSQVSADWNDDGDVDLLDFGIVADNWKEYGDGVFKGHYALDANSYAPCGLELGRTYYWRVDEVNDPCVWRGEVWNFKVEEYPTFRGFSGVCRHTYDPLRPLYDNALGWGRRDIFWSVLEPYAPNTPSYLWRQEKLDEYGDLVLAYNAKDAHLLPILDYGTEWSGGLNFVDANHVDDWQNYVWRVVDFLRRPPYSVEFFQVWNEPDLYYFWNGDTDTFMTNVHLPASEVIHNLGCKVVFGGWVGAPSGLVDLLDAHNAWDSIDVVDMHYRPISDWQYLRDAAAARGYNDIPVWETEVGYTTNLHYLSNFYPRLFYWALTHNADIGPDVYKVFYYREFSPDDPGAEGYHRTLYSGDNIWHLGTSLQTLGDLFDGGMVSDYTDITNDKLLSAETSEGNSSIEGFEVDADPNRIVVAVHLMSGDVSNPDTETITLVFSEFTQAEDVNNIKRVDVAGYETSLAGSYDINGLTVAVPVANDAGSPVQGWSLDESMYNFYMVITRNE